jgi:hypothetical protein
MRASTFALLATLATVPGATQADPPPAATAGKPAPARPTAWQGDPVCRMVFHAVLEGLYEDGVPNAVVDAVVPRQPKPGVDPVKRSFVAQCPLCHPVYEAFAAYQKRPAFAADPAGRDTFGKGLDTAVVEALTADDPKTRLQALAPLVKRWVERRLTAMRLTAAEKVEWEAKLADRSREGKAFLAVLMKSDPSYKGWSWYWGCAACNGTTDACRAVKAGGSKE